MYTIRPATIDDFKNIQKLNTEVFVDNIKWDGDIVQNYSTTKQGAKYFKEALQRKDGCFLVCEEDDVLIGYANGHDMHANWRKSRYFELENIGVLSEKTRMGIGKALLDEITSWAKEQGFEKMYLNSYVKNKGALEFYKQNGYEEIDICLERKI